jgi:oligogalacturonide lyase
MRSALLMAAALLLPATAAWAEVGKRYPSEKRVITDAVTSRPLTLLTSGAVGDAKIYPTHPQWAKDGVNIVFRSGERAGAPQIFAVNETTGDIVQLTEGPGVDIGSINVARLSNRVFYLRNSDTGQTLKSIDLTALLVDSKAGKLKAEGYETSHGDLPAGFINAGGFTLDADEKTAYFGFDQEKAPPRPLGGPVPQVPGGILAMDITTGKTRTVVTSEFRMGHVQANPFKPGEILYCWETGGDAPQRMWIVNADGTGNREVFKESPDDWVTHEQFADADHVIFNLLGHTPTLSQRPTGIMVVSLRTGEVENLGQMPFSSKARSFWHNGVTYDGRLAAGDTFNGDLYLIDRASGERKLLSTGHFMKPDHLHPSFSADNTRLLVQSGLLTEGRKLSLIVIPVN